MCSGLVLNMGDNPEMFLLFLNLHRAKAFSAGEELGVHESWEEMEPGQESQTHIAHLMMLCSVYKVGGRMKKEHVWSEGVCPCR